MKKNKITYMVPQTEATIVLIDTTLLGGSTQKEESSWDNALTKGQKLDLEDFDEAVNSGQKSSLWED